MITDGQRRIIESRARAGKEALDLHIPQWREHVDIGQLNLANCFQCILGQQPHGYTDTLEILAALVGQDPCEMDTALGFDADFQIPDPMYMAELTLAWIRLLQEEDEEKGEIPQQERDLVTV